jgi:hypothetical protein
MSKRFLVFHGESYYPEGGWKDFAIGFDTEAEALNYVIEDQKNPKTYSERWHQIVDLEKQEIIKELWA